LYHSAWPNPHRLGTEQNLSGNGNTHSVPSDMSHSFPARLIAALPTLRTSFLGGCRTKRLAMFLKNGGIGAAPSARVRAAPAAS
jgi:hypothetical protein